ncbi:uncharacterized protein LOC131639760 [Vicia villosa]|uniref:uncharacterized protein LOC131639760 n=1 Tax=Vicia villosa TaxID=3911 RepID=UPI00273C3F32|nr:uncharacterized protein LOC131639760 [Vicia villosa]
MDCTLDQKVWYETHMLAVEANDWWLETCRRLEANGEEISWIVFCMEFLRKYFPEDVRGKKEIEFIELKQGNKSVVEYAAKQKSVALSLKKYAGKFWGITVGHKSTACNIDAKRCYRCGKFGHALSECTHKEMVCFNCAEEGHIGRKCQKAKKEQSSGKVEMVVDTPAKGSVTTSLVCLKFLVSIFDRDFLVDFVCFPLRGLDVILGMNWLERNRVHIDCYDKSVRFSSPEEEGVELFSVRQLRLLVKKDVQVFSLVASMSVENQAIIEELKVVCEFPEVFPDVIPDVPPEREVDFSIDLVPGIRPMSLAPYRMSTSELFELKKQLEELLERRLIAGMLSILMVIAQ